MIEDLDGVENVNIQSPGFININLTSDYWNIFLKELLINGDNYGVNKNIKKENIWLSLCPQILQGHCMLVIAEELF